MFGVFVIGTGAFHEANPAAGDPADTVSGVLESPANRWDGGWFLSIAENGYDRPSPSATAFFPLYPLSIRIVGELIGSFALAGIIVSLVAFWFALYLLHRLTALEAGHAAADRAALLLAFFPTAFYFSAIYSESLFLALSLGCVYSARLERWGWAAVLAALATATRSAGLMLIVPLLIMVLYGPRGSGRAPGVKEAGAVVAPFAALLAYMAYVKASTPFGATAPFKAHQEWTREFKGPIIGLWGGVKNGAAAVRGFLNGAPVNEPVSAVRGDLLNVAALAFASLGVFGALRRLPLAYGAYALAGLVFAISFPGNGLVLTSLPRLVIVLFPIFMWLGIVTECRSYHGIALGASAVGLGLLSTMFASGYWIA
jgi:Mannosyltransferase (PIG-V)